MVVVGLALLLPLSVILGLRSDAVRQSILARVAAAVEDRSGIRLSVGDFRLGLTNGVVEILDLELRMADAGAGPPFLVVPQARAVVRWRTLRGELPTIESLEIENPRLDLSAALPTFGNGTAGSETDAGSSFPALDVLEFELSGGEVIGAAAPDSMDVWLDAWRAYEIRIRGALRSNQLRIDEASVRWIGDSHRREPLELHVIGSASGDVSSGSITLDSLRIRGNGLNLEGDGNLETSAKTASLTFEMDAEPALLFPDLTSGGRLKGNGDLRIERIPEPTLRGTLRIDATEIPGELADPWVSVETGGFLDTAGTLLDVAVDLDVNIALSNEDESRSGDKVLGKAEASWRRGTEQLFTASIRSLEGDEGVNLAFTGELTPAAPGRRRVSGELRAPSFADVLEGSLRSVRIDLVEPDAARAAERFGLDPRAIPGWWPRGAVTASLEADGPITAPGLRLDARWDHEGGEPLAVLSAHTLDDPGLRLQFAASFLPEAYGQRELSGELAAPGWQRLAEGEIRDGRLVLELADLGDADADLARRLPEFLPEGLVPDEVSNRLLLGGLTAHAEIAGPLLSPDLSLDANWTPAPGETAQLVIHGRPAGEFPFLEPGGTATLDLENLSLFRIDPADPPLLSGSIDASLKLNSSDAGLAGSLRLDGRELSYGELVSLQRLRLEATSDGHTIEVDELSGTLVTGTPELPVRGEFLGEGSSDAAWPPGHAEARLSITNPVAGVDRIETAFRLQDGILQIEKIAIESPGNVAMIQGTVPLGTLVGESAPGPISLTVSDLDLRILTELFQPEEDALPLHGMLNGSLDFDPANPLSSVGSLEISGISVGVQGEAPLELEQTVRIEMHDGKVVLPPTHLKPTGKLIRGDAPLDIAATVVLAQGWKPGDDPVAALESLSLDLDGTVDASLLNPFLAGGSASGEVAVKLSARGSPETLSATVSIRGPESRVLYLRPYPTRLEGLEIDLVVRQGEVTLERARAKLNGGDAEMSGTITADEGLRANLRFDGARYRLDLGIVTSLRGNLDLEWPTVGRRRISGTVVVERAVLRRDVTLNFSRELVGALFDVQPEAGGAIALDTIDLDLVVLTDQGVLIKNNVADVQGDWGRVEISGTAASPLFDGRVDVQPGGIITAFGQALRIDEAFFEWSGDPVTEPRMVFETTSSIDDPTILKSWRNEFVNPGDMGPGRGGTLDFWGRGETAQTGGWEQVAAGAVTQATSATRTQLTFEPLPLFGETDTQARYTLISDLSPQLSFIASTNPRETEAQTYILDIHQLPFFSSFRAQVFTNDQKNAGVTVQQTLRLGTRSETDTRDPFLKATTIDTGDGVPKRRIRKAIGFRKSDPFPHGAGLDVEVDVIDLMRRRGFPSADVDVVVESSGTNRVDLFVTVQPGVPVQFVFEGDPLPSRTHKSIVSSYLPVELGQEAALEEVQRATVIALRSMGFLEPRADVELAPVDLANPDGAIVIRVVARGGRQVELAEVVVEGLADEEAEGIASLFSATLARVSLAAESPATDARLLRALDGLGYPDGRIVGRELSEDGQVLVVQVEPGKRRRVASIEIVGLTEEDRARLAEMLDLREGDPAVNNRIGLAGRLIERDLRERGHAEARVTAKVKPAANDRPYDMDLRYEVDPGASYRIEEVRFEGLKVSREKWVAAVAGLESGQLFRRRDVAEARARLFRTGAFRRIQTTTDFSESDGQETVVTFELEEARRWQLAYGARWEEGRGASAVVDLLNRHSLGRGHLTGVRVIYGSEQKNLRLYHIIPRIVGERSSLELFVEGKRERFDEEFDLRNVEFWAQLTFPLSARIQNRPYISFQNPRLVGTGPNPGLPADQRVVSPLLGWQFAFDSLSRRIGEDRRQGLFLGVDLLGSHEALGSDVTLFGVVSQAKYFLPLGRSRSGRLTWAQFWRGGINEAVDQSVPLLDRFRVGGEFSVRGYPTNSLGPQGPDGLPLGGELLFVVNQELHALLLRTERAGTVSALAFFDAGNVWLNRDSLGGGLFKSVGVGARYNSPFGPLRLDFAVPLDRRPDDPDYTVHFGFGSVF